MKRMSEQLRETEQKLASLQQESAEHSQMICELTEKLRAAHGELERSTADFKKRRAEFRQRIRTLESRLQDAGADSDKKGAKAENATSSTELEQLQFLSSENKRLTAELTAVIQSMRGGADGSCASMEQLQAELQALARELVPTKNKLAEYMAMADRLGIRYPFSPEMEGAAVLRMGSVSSKAAPSGKRRERASVANGDGRGSSNDVKEKRRPKKNKTKPVAEEAQQDVCDLR
ncbi:hypothetical protein ERJ75_000244300 [Trypanosoma vivax]|nr:hypothetical protein ERJ75_000244300 [Trypanosoma vivax]